MRSRRLAVGLILPIALVALVALLATLQYRWLGQVNEAERDRMRTSLRQSAKEFADDFDRELVTVYQALQPNSTALFAHDWASFSAHFDNWRKNTKYPQLVKAVYLMNDDGTRPEFLEYRPDAQAFESADWPVELADVKSAISNPHSAPPPPPPPVAVSSMIETVRGSSGGGGAGGRGGGGSFTRVTTRDQLFPLVPAIAISTPSIPLQSYSLTGTSSGFQLTDIKLRTSTVVVVLDKEYLRTTMLPDLVARRFLQSADQYRITVVNNSDAAHPLFVHGLPPSGTIDTQRADATESLFALRFDLAKPVLIRQSTTPTGDSQFIVEGRTVTAVATPKSTAPPPPPAAPPARVPDGPMRATAGAMSIVLGARGDVFNFTTRPGNAGHWQLAVQHSAGSLDAAVGKLRRRNLWLSFGILGVLVAGVGLIVINAERSRKLAGQQMDFVATVSHELRTPLTVIRSAAQNLSAGVVSDPAQAKQYGDLIEAEGRRLTDMVEQVLEYAGLSGNRTLARTHAVDAGAIAREVVDTSAAFFEMERVEVMLDVADGLPPVLADENALRRALQNLVTNALKYGADGRWIGIAVRAAKGRSGADEVQLSVTDRGRGIDADDLPHIFEAFYRGRYAVDRQIHGNGLGLSLVKRIAEAHGGRVTVESTPGQGATFTIHLPAASPDPAPSTIGEPVTEDGR